MVVVKLSAREVNMSGLEVKHQINNLEIIAKLMNSVAVKYNCSVKYNQGLNRLDFSGDKRCRRDIAEATVGMFRNDAVEGVSN